MDIHPMVSPHALERFQRPRNYGALAQFNGHARITGPCGDTMEIWLQVAGGRIAQAGFTTTGCGPSRAAGSMATECAMGKLLEEAVRIERSAKEMGVPFLGRVPIDPQIVECGDSGVPYIHRFAESEAAKAFGGIVDRILDAVKLLKSSV